MRSLSAFAIAAALPIAIGKTLDSYQGVTADNLVMLRLLCAKCILGIQQEVVMQGMSRIALLACFFATVSAGSYAQMYLSSLPEVPLTKEDYQDLSAAYQPLLNDDSLPIGTTREWSNVKSGNQGTVQLLKRFEFEYQGSKLPCRKLKYHIQIKNNADPYNVMLNRCRVADGSWKIL